jgi:hypothetical protein
VKKPFRYEGDKPIEWTFSQLADLIKGLDEMGCLDEIATEADRQNLLVHLPPNSVNFVKEFLFERQLHKKNQQAREVIASASCGNGPPTTHCVPDCIPCFPSRGVAEA